MKTFLAINTIVIFFFVEIKGQQIIVQTSSQNASYNSNLQELSKDIMLTDTGEGNKINALQRFQEFWEDRLPNDNNATIDFKNFACGNYHDFMTKKGTEYCKNNIEGNWKLLGPKQIMGQNMGRVETIWADTSFGKENHIIVGSWGGGLWETGDMGQNWVNITDNNSDLAGTFLVKSLAVDPHNNERIYLSSDVIGLNSGGYAVGVLKRENANDKWERDDDLMQLIFGTSDVSVTNKTIVAFDPYTSSSNLYVAHENRLFRKINTGPWVELTAAGSFNGKKVNSINFSVSNPGFLFIGCLGLQGSYNIDASFWTFNSTSNVLTEISSLFNFTDNVNFINDPNFTQPILSTLTTNRWSDQYGVDWFTSSVGVNHAEISPTNTSQYLIYSKDYFTPDHTNRFRVNITLPPKTKLTIKFASSINEVSGQPIFISEQLLPDLTYSGEFFNTTSTSTNISIDEDIYLTGHYHRFLILQAEQLVGYTAALGNIQIDGISFIPNSSWDYYTSSVSKPDELFLLSNTRLGRTYLFKYDYTSNSVVKITNNLGITGVTSFAVSNDNHNRIYMGQSTGYPSPLIQMNLTFTAPSTYTWSTTNLTGVGGNQLHADLRFLFLRNPNNDPNSDEIFLGTDGGISRKPISSANNAFLNINGNGLSIATLYGFSSSEHEGYISTGAQDDGVFTYNKNRTTPWLNTNYGDGGSTLFDRKSKDISFITSWGFLPAPSSNNGIIGRIDADNIALSVNSISPPSEPGINPLVIRDFDYDHNDESYVGYQRVYRFDNTQNPPWFNDLDFNGILQSQTGPDLTRKFTVDKSDPLNIYLAKNIDNGSRFFVRHTSISPTNTLNDRELKITSSNISCNGLRVSDIVVDPKNFARVWVSFGDLVWNGTQKAQSVRRVIFSSDYGATWVDLSNGLPEFPVNVLEYYVGSDDIIFAGTDVGVYKFIKATNEWIPFVRKFNADPNINECIAPMIVTDLDVNYCAGKLFMSTWGRSIWESDLYMPNNNPAQTNIIENANETWTTDKYIEGGIRVKASRTLTILGTSTNPVTVHMPKYGKIIVEKGAKLIVDGATITNSCDQMWHGIFLEADPNLRQMSTTGGYYTQGYCSFQNGAVIENSENGVANYNSGSLGGGIILASNTIFRNNRRSVEFMKYQNENSSGTPIPDWSKFTGCTFEVNDNMSQQAAFTYHVTMWAVDGIQFKGCEFKNLQTDATVGNEKAIYTIDANYSLSANCGSSSFPCTSIIPNKFDNFDYAIHSTGWTEYRPIISDQSEFRGNQFGIFFETVNNPVLLRNKFDIGNLTIPPTLINLSLGTYLSETHQFRMEENEFIKTSGTSNFSIGLWIHNSFDDNVVYKNKFENLLVGNYSEGMNRWQSMSSPEFGLKYICNIQDNNTYHMFQADDPPGSAGGIHKQQGDFINILGIQKTAGNTFENSSSGSFSDINNSSSTPFDYYYSSGITEPNNITSSMVIKQSGFAVNDCPSHFSETDDNQINLPGGFISYKSQYYITESEYTGVLYNYQSLLDGGNTEQFINNIVGAWGSDVLELRNQLLSESPYVTQVALREVAENNLLPQAILLEVLIANPNATSDISFLDFLRYEKPNPMSETMIDLIMQSWNTDTYRDAIERTLSGINQKRVNECNRIINAIFSDTIRVEYDSLGMWISKIGSLASRYDYIEFLLGNNQSALAEATLNSIPLDYELSDEETAHFNVYENLFNFKKDLREDNREIHQLNSSEIASLQIIADALPNSYASLRAQNALCFFYNICKPKEFNIQFSQNRISKTTISQTKEHIKVYPNPAKEFIIFEYGSLENIKVEYVTLTDLSGKKLKIEKLNPSQNQFVLNTKDLNNGTYIYTITTTSGEKYTGKVSIQK